MAEDEFYVEDETPEEVKAAWREGEKGVTNGSRDLNQSAKSIVDRAAERLEREPARAEVISTEAVRTITVETEATFAAEPGAARLRVIESGATEPVSA